VPALARMLPSRAESLRARTLFDTSLDGATAPHTDFVSRKHARELFSEFAHATVRSENANAITLHGHMLIRRERLLRTVGPVAGLDLYIRATK